MEITGESAKKYGEDLIKNAERILKEISENPHIRIKLVLGADDFCRQCRQLDKCNLNRIGAEELDREYIGVIGCRAGAVYSFDELLKRGKEFVRFQKSQPLAFRSWMGKKLLLRMEYLR